MQELAQNGKLDEQQQSTQGGRCAVVYPKPLPRHAITEIMQELAQKGKLDEQQQSTQGGRCAVV